MFAICYDILKLARKIEKKIYVVVMYRSEISTISRIKIELVIIVKEEVCISIWRNINLGTRHPLFDAISYLDREKYLQRMVKDGLSK